MKYTNIKKAVFIERPNRFIAHAKLDGETVVAHVKNTGRCKELLVEGAVVYLDEPQGKNRKTRYDLVAVEKRTEDGRKILINMDSQAPNEAVAEWLPKSGLFSEGAKIRREVTVGGSRFDFAIYENDKTTYLEVKGVTLEVDGEALFPDAPTERGVKHLRELSSLAREGWGCAVLFVIQMKGMHCFKPNTETHPEFGEALSVAANSGVRLLCYDSRITDNEMIIDQPIDIIL
ncbi:MAG: DNA/RNA nuclease SfsA [Clostridia bacterium]|nr:DNA/RNA nuclease SfsA [Clostridia bacterium]